jgi:hypothetical protein
VVSRIVGEKPEDVGNVGPVAAAVVAENDPFGDAAAHRGHRTCVASVEFRAMPAASPPGLKRFLWPGGLVGAEIVAASDDGRTAAREAQGAGDKIRDGMRCYLLEIRETEIDNLIARKSLKAEMRNDKQAVIDAIYEVFEEYLN